jgi:hypothetical protein
MVSSPPLMPPEAIEARVAFSAARSKAINTFAGLEEYMAHLFATLMQADSKKSYFVFSRLLMPRARRDVLSHLIELTYGSQFELFFSSLMKRIGELDIPRNRIVHWIAKETIPPQGQFAPPNNVFLCEHPDIFGRQKMFIAEIQKFTEKADFIGLVVFYFDIYLKHGRRPDAPGSPWPDIFQQRCTYPPPMEHPLVRLRKKQPDQPEPSQGSHS